MKRILLIASLLFAVNFAYAQADTLRYQNGNVFIGDTEKSSGTLHTKAGDIYIGSIKDGIPEGICTHYTKNGSKKGNNYYGGFRDGVYWGKGRINFSYGNVLISDFVDGKPIAGDGIIVNKDGAIYYGQIRNGVPNGEGKMYRAADKGYFEGQFVNGVLVQGYIYSKLTSNQQKMGVSPCVFISISRNKRRSSVPAVAPTTPEQAANEYAALRYQLKTYQGEKLTKEQIEFSK